MCRPCGQREDKKPDWISPNGVWEIQKATRASRWIGYVKNTTTGRTHKFGGEHTLPVYIPNYVHDIIQELWSMQKFWSESI